MADGTWNVNACHNNNISVINGHHVFEISTIHTGIFYILMKSQLNLVHSTKNN